MYYRFQDLFSLRECERVIWCILLIARANSEKNSVVSGIHDLLNSIYSAVVRWLEATDKETDFAHEGLKEEVKRLCCEFLFWDSAFHRFCSEYFSKLQCVS